MSSPGRLQQRIGAALVDLGVVVVLMISVVLILSAFLRLTDFAVSRLTDYAGLAEFWYERIAQDPFRALIVSGAGILTLTIAMLAPIHGYFVSMEARGGQTIGKRWFRLRVVIFGTYNAPTRPAAMKREIARWLIDYGLLPIGLLMVMMRPDRRRLGDLWANTQVVTDLDQTRPKQQGN